MKEKKDKPVLPKFTIAEMNLFDVPMVGVFKNKEYTAYTLSPLAGIEIDNLDDMEITVEDFMANPENKGKKVGGVDSSAHTIGYGVDLVSGDFKVFSNFIKSYFQSHPEIKFDQVIIEKSGKSHWIHIGLYNKEHKQRGQLFNISK